MKCPICLKTCDEINDHIKTQHAFIEHFSPRVIKLSKRFGLTELHCAILSILEDHPKGISIAQVAKKLGRDSDKLSGVGSVLKSLHNRDIVCRSYGRPALFTINESL